MHVFNEVVRPPVRRWHPCEVGDASPLHIRCDKVYEVAARLEHVLLRCALLRLVWTLVHAPEIDHEEQDEHRHCDLWRYCAAHNEDHQKCECCKHQCACSCVAAHLRERQLGPIIAIADVLRIRACLSIDLFVDRVRHLCCVRCFTCRHKQHEGDRCSACDRKNLHALLVLG